MLKALDRNIAAVSDRIVLLAPSVAAVGDVFHKVDINPERHSRLLDELQKLRGDIYLKDGAIRQDQLSLDGRHQTSEDEKSWHFLLLNPERQVEACALYLEHEPDVRFEDTRAAINPLTQDPAWRQQLWRAVESELTRARRERLRYVELGGWAVSEKSRGTAGPLALALAVWAFGRRQRGALGMTTATFRHCSATILKRLGGARFEVDGMTLPEYFDARYGCMMELLRFDSRRPNPKYVGLIEQVRKTLGEIEVVSRPSALELATAPVRALRLDGAFQALAS